MSQLGHKSIAGGGVDILPIIQIMTSTALHSFTDLVVLSYKATTLVRHDLPWVDPFWLLLTTLSSM